MIFIFTNFLSIINISQIFVLRFSLIFEMSSLNRTKELNVLNVIVVTHVKMHQSILKHVEFWSVQMVVFILIAATNWIFRSKISTLFLKKLLFKVMKTCSAAFKLNPREGNFKKLSKDVNKGEITIINKFTEKL